MYKVLFAVTAIVLMTFGGSAAQCDQHIFVADQDDLPYSGPSYTPCASSFSYVFEFDILWQTNPFTDYAIVYPKVIESVLNISVTSWRYNPGTDYQKTGNSFTGTGSDYLHIGILPGGAQDVFANMDWSVRYYNDEPD